MKIKLKTFEPMKDPVLRCDGAVELGGRVSRGKATLSYKLVKPRVSAVLKGCSDWRSDRLVYVIAALSRTLGGSHAYLICVLISGQGDHTYDFPD